MSLALMSLLVVTPARAAAPEDVLTGWYNLLLNLVRHTATYSPPVAARAFAYVGITSYEATASGNPKLRSFAGQLKDLKSLPQRESGKKYDESVVLNAALDAAMQDFFANTGPSGQQAMKAHSAKLKMEVAKGLPKDVVTRSETYGRNLEKAILTWSKLDGGSVVVNLGFPPIYEVSKEPGHWVPTNMLQIQQHPLLPLWGKNHPLAMPESTSCALEPQPKFSTEPVSDFYKMAKEVYDVTKALTPEQKTIARFWSDDPGLSWTPPGHWVGIVLDIMDQKKLDVAHAADALARVGIAINDGFIGCWADKYKYDTIRPITYIKKNIDPKFEPILITPPFPEYPSGHSSQSGAVAEALTAVFGPDFAFDDHTHERDGLGVRHFKSFWDAAKEAGISRLYGGIHFRAAIDNGLQQGQCVGQYVVKLTTFQ
ncbi:vanadium-dependent haloperoxidase [Aestuariivirga litoralis]|nr:vanadium-dependent haloperoxidase [Aestuariivirga litoralis]